MKVILLAAGKGTRLGLLTQHFPKPMLPIGGRPILEHTLLLLKRYGLVRFFINLHHFPEIIQSHFGNGSRWGVSISYSYEEQLLGTAGAVRKIIESKEWEMDKGNGGENQDFWVLYGDNYFDCDLFPLLAFHRKKGGLGTIGLHWREDVLSSGIVDLDEGGRILRILEKPKPEEIFSHIVSAGVFILKPKIIDFIPEGFSDFGHDVFPKVIEAGKIIYGHLLNGRVMGIDTIEAYRSLVNRVGGKE